MTQSAKLPDLDDEVAGPESARSDRRLDLFLKFGALALVVLVAGFGVLYFLDQRTTKPPSIVTQQITQAEQAVRDQPNNVGARLALGTLYFESGRRDDSIAQFSEVIKVDPQNQDALLGRGRVLLDKGDLMGATADFSAVTSMRREGEFAGADKRLQAAYYWLGVVALKQEQPDQAIDQLNHALSITPTDSDSLFLYGQAQAKKGQHDAAITTYRKALAFVPIGWCEPYQAMQTSFTALNNADEASYAQAMAQYCTGDTTNGKQKLTQLVDGPAGVDASLGLALVAQLENDDKGAEAWYRKALERDPKNITAITGLAGLGVTPEAPKK